MSGKSRKKDPTWYYFLMAFNALAILFGIGLLRDLMWIF